MLSKLQSIPNRWKLLVVFLLVLVHALPLLLAASLLWPNERNTLNTVSHDPPLSFIQTKSRLYVGNMESSDPLSSAFKIRLNTHSQTNQLSALRRDLTLLYQDGVLVGKMDHSEKNADIVKQQLELTSKYNHLFQAISFHYAENQNQVYSHHMSDDYLYVSATKYGGIQTFHQPETVQQQNWKQIIDRTLHERLNLEYNEALKKFEMHPNDYFLFPLTQLPLYNSTDQLPGIPPERSAEIIRRIWSIIDNHIVKEVDTKAKGSSLPLILLAKDGTSMTVLYRTADGLYHQWEQPVEDVLK